jgi:hypothetical protein
MVMMDHVGNINDVAFSPDDQRMFTCSLDGYIYEWDVLAGNRVAEHSFPKIPVTRVFCTNTAFLALLEPAMDVVAANKSRKRGSTERSRSASGVALKNRVGELFQNFSSGGYNRKKAQVATWQGRDLSKPPDLVEIPFRLSSIAVGKFQGMDPQDFVAFGCADRDVIVSLFPFPISASLERSTFASFAMSEYGSADDDSGQQSPQSQTQHVTNSLDLEYCRRIPLHNGAVTSLAVSRNGLWILTGGADGSINLLGTSKKYPLSRLVPEASGTESRVTMINLAKLRRQHSRLDELEGVIQDTIARKDREMSVIKVNTQKQVSDLEAKLKREVEKRDQIIIAERNEYIRKTKEHAKEFNDLRERGSKDLTILEVGYEKKLAKESEYLHKMQQAYDEFVVHARLDLAEANRKAERREIEFDEQSLSLESGLDKTKSILMMYCEYVSNRYQEVKQRRKYFLIVFFFILPLIYSLRIIPLFRLSHHSRNLTKKSSQISV